MLPVRLRRPSVHALLLALCWAAQCNFLALKARADVPARAAASFTLPEAAPAQLRDARTIALTGSPTTPIVPATEASIPLLGSDGARLGPLLDEGQFCELAAAGAGVIDGASYRVIGTARVPQISCRRYFSRLARKMPVAAGALGRSVFARIDSPHGLGARDFLLVPWRSIATASFPLGAVLYVPMLRGQRIDGEQVHDGYVFVADDLDDAPRAQAILSIGNASSALRIHSHAFVVNAPAIQAALQALHRPPRPRERRKPHARMRRMRGFDTGGW